jgi:phosphoglycerate dehydrogenase-like enzyme
MIKPAPRILLHNDSTDALAERLRHVAPDAQIACCQSYADLPAKIAAFKPDIAYSICFNGRAGFPREALLGPGGPEWIAVGGSGVDHLAPWDEARVTVTNSAGVAAPMMAEYVFGTVLHFTLDIAGLEADRLEQHWRSARLMTPLRGKTILIVGLGHTGRAVAARAKAFGMIVIGTRARPEGMENVDEVHTSNDLPGLWHRADVVVLCVPLLPTTHSLMNAHAFALMKDTAILVDVSRGGVLDTAALTNAMRNEAIAGAAIDVFETEPLPYGSPLWGLENVIISPHCSAVYAEWSDDAFTLFLENLECWRKGDQLRNVVDPDRGY